MSVAELREKLAKLTDAELAKRLYLIGLVARLDTELLVMATFFGSGDEPMRLEPPPDARVTALQHMMMQEMKQRSAVSAFHEREKGGHEDGNTNSTH